MTFWSTVRLIWLRELRDQLRDRRTMVTIVVLPLLLYPLLSYLALYLASQLLNRPSRIGVVGGDPATRTFPRNLSDANPSPMPEAAESAVVPLFGESPACLAARCRALREANAWAWHYQPLIEHGQIPWFFRREQKPSAGIFAGSIILEFEFFQDDGQAALAGGDVDLIVEADERFADELSRGGSPEIRLHGRPNDESSRRAAAQVRILLGRWKAHLKGVRLRRQGLPEQFDQPFRLVDDLQPDHEEILAAQTLLDLMIRTFPFLLVMWSLVGALHPAVDLCAGEKERGTMETLLISPAERSEIVYGKFLAIWVFSAGTAILHLVSMVVSTWPLRGQLPQAVVTVPVFFWCALLVVPMAALFSAVSLAIGAYARSTKEGQYYLMPLFWIVMPLVLLTLLPDVELNPFYSMVPVTGVALLMQRLMIAPSLDSAPWLYFIPVFASILLWSWLALQWATWQFQREEVLFRSSERMQWGRALRETFGRKEATPTLAQALLCFAILFGLRWLVIESGSSLPLITTAGVVLLGLVMAPPLLMSLVLTTRPDLTLRLRWPKWSYLLAAVLLLPVAEAAQWMLMQLPELETLFRERRAYIWGQLTGVGNLGWGHYVAALSLLPAIGKELAFRGFILRGLEKRMSFWPAVLFSSLLFAVFHMNVFAILPLFLLGVAAAVLTLRSGSLLPAVVLHAGCNALLLRDPLPGSVQLGESAIPVGLVLMVAAGLCAAGAGILLGKAPTIRISTTGDRSS